MKILKYLLFVVVGLIVIYLLIGFIKPSVTYGHEISVNKPLKEAWAVSHDVSKLGQWLQGFKSIELISGDSGTVGSKYRILVNPGEGQPDFEMIETVVSKKDFEHIALSLDSEMMVFEQTMSFAEADGKVTVKTDSKVMGKSMLTRPMFALMEWFSGAFTAQEVKNIEALKKVIEENTTNYYPSEG